MRDESAVTAALAHSLSALERLRSSRAFVFDMDGTLVLGDKTNHGLNPLPGALEITRLLSERGVPFVLFTNGTARTPQQYVGMLRDVGFPLPDNGSRSLSAPWLPAHSDSRR